ncbi:hypothetical protein GOV04_01110 [Candidatus Woesearchaeota archaeon]|nr:hypothetical protein [Candidatus Woesearchaeota archaeon]
MAAKQKAAKDLHKLQVNISKKALNDLEELRTELEATSKAEVIKASLKLYKFITEEKLSDKGAKVLLRDSKGNIKEIIF